ncbi:energy-coupling factor transporter transmembrane protein EcfT [Sporolactobacillus shoreicorticis]|uniref:Energy-coupling factor transporter transmembrane protein EcfT n=1 Tax=Sporolactobacillus shoreicorticis TaxID=1923877 RepID=A0ABW5S9K1_9BACL|nr:energy-coupling factor transporter transmembrane component T [Sporolactobacillus shoreicorticis]MCO7127419.1 energy-coupling factor transporter transmembrane protein EcfT [Sporolactobacillus shoreicorticis]
MMFNLVIGQYVPLDSYVHHLDPRSKLIGVFLFVVIVFLANNWLTNILMILFCFAGILLSKMQLSYIYRGLRSILLIVLLTFVLNLFLASGGTTLFSWGWFHVTTGGLTQSVFIAVRIMVIIVVTTLLTLTTSPIEITDGMESLLNPLKKIKMPVHEFALMMSISLRFIPTLLEETEKIIKAQAARGSDFTTGSLRGRIKAIVPLLVPLFVGAFKRAEDLAMAMEARGYHGDDGRTKLHQLKWSWRDSLLISALVLLALLLIFARN